MYWQESYHSSKGGCQQCKSHEESQQEQNQQACAEVQKNNQDMEAMLNQSQQEFGDLKQQMLTKKANNVAKGKK